MPSSIIKVDGCNSIAIQGTATGDNSLGVLAKGDAVGLRAESKGWHAVVGVSEKAYGIYGKGGSGVVGESDGWMGVYGKSCSTTGGAGVMGEGDPGPGVMGKSTKWIGVYGETAGVEGGPAGVWGEHKGAGCGVKAVSKDGVGLAAYSGSNEAIHAESSTAGGVIAAYNKDAASGGCALYARKDGPQGHAGFFEGNVKVTGTLDVVKDMCLPPCAADCAEDFDVADPVAAEPGTVMVVGEAGALQPCERTYDKRVAGVISGAGAYRPGIVLDKQHARSDRKPIALVGKVYCKVDASLGAIEVGDLLTTSARPGYAMKAIEPMKAFGAVIGKALQAHPDGQGLIPILIALQ